MAEPFDITDETELREAIRGETQYDENNISTEDLNTVVDSAKRVLALRADTTDFFADRGITTALLGIACAKAKGAVENSPVRVDNIGSNDVTFRTSDGSSLQLGQYESMTRLGLSNTSVTDEGTQTIEFTRDFLRD